MDTFSAIAEPTRRAIMEMLARRGPLSATQIYESFEATHPAISQHLKVLREANLVMVEKRGQQRIYRINAQAVNELEDWARKIADRWNRRFDALEQVIAAEKKKLEAEDQKEQENGTPEP
jgi:DNA-binding transcriptional ArsR family regulator